MRFAVVVLLVVLCCPALALAQARIAGVELETTEPEIRVVIELDPPNSTPATRLMRGDHALRLRFAHAIAGDYDESIDDETLRRVRLLTYRGRVVLRMDPRAADAVDLLERAEVQPHPRGLAIVIQRSDNESSRYQARHRQREASSERAEATADESDEAPAVPAAPTARPETNDNDEPTVASTNRRPSERPEHASSSDTATPPASESTTTGTIRAALTVGFVLFLGGVAWYMKRRRGVSGSARKVRTIDVVAAKRIGPRQSLLLVEVCGQTLLVGATEKGMARLATIDAASEEIDDLIGDDVVLTNDEEIAAPRHNEGRDLTPLERELRRSLPVDDEDRPGDVPISPLAGLLASRAVQRVEQTIGATSQTSAANEIEPEAVEGLLRLRKMADGPGSPRTSHKGHANGNGDMSLAALESLLISRQQAN